MSWELGCYESLCVSHSVHFCNFVANFVFEFLFSFHTRFYTRTLLRFLLSSSPPKTRYRTESSPPLVVPYLSPVVLRKEVESFIIQEGGKGLEKEELVRDRCVYRQKGAEGGMGRDW